MHNSDHLPLCRIVSFQWLDHVLRQCYFSEGFCFYKNKIRLPQVLSSSQISPTAVEAAVLFPRCSFSVSISMLTWSSGVQFGCESVFRQSQKTKQPWELLECLSVCLWQALTKHLLFVCLSVSLSQTFNSGFSYLYPLNAGVICTKPLWLVKYLLLIGSKQERTTDQQEENAPLCLWTSG